MKNNPSLLLILYTFFLLAVNVQALPEDLNTLEQRSPFLPPNAVNANKTQNTAGNVPPLTTEIEYRGYYTWQGTVQVSIFNRKDNKSQWMKLGEKFGNYKFVSFNSEQATIVIERDDRQETLTLKKPSNTPVIIASHQIPPPQKPPQGTPVQGIPPIPQTGDQANPPPPPRRRIIVPTPRQGGTCQNSPTTPQNGQRPPPTSTQGGQSTNRPFPPQPQSGP